MLGWFKRTFGKKKDEPVAAEAVPVELTAEEIAGETPPPAEGAAAEVVVVEAPAAAAETEAPVEAAAAEPVLPAEGIAVVREEPAPEPPVVEPPPEAADAPPEPAAVQTPAPADDLVEIEAPEAAAAEPEQEEVAQVATDLSPEPEILPEAEILPAAEVVPEQAAVGEQDVAPELETVKEPEVAPEPEPEPEPVEAAEPEPTPEPAAEPPEPIPPEPADADAPAPPSAELPAEPEEPEEPGEASEEIVPAPPISARTQEKPASRSMFQRLQERLGKTRDALIYRLDRLFLGKKEIDQDLFEQLEEILITADLGVATTLELIDVARKKVKRDQLSDPQALKGIIRDQILAYIEASDQPAELVLPETGPFVIMVVGVNGVGKTTTIGKIAAKFARAGQSVLLVAADTFRAAAIDQLRIWGERVGVRVIAQKPNADPSSVVFDGLDYGVAHDMDVIIIDTAGRLHTSVNLMAELKKIHRVIGKKMPGAPHEVMLVLDATTGQNGIAQAKMFHEAVGVTGLTLTKLDGTAKGGIVANVCREIKIPVRFIGIGEQLDDLRDFDAREFVDALFAGQAGGAAAAR